MTCIGNSGPLAEPIVEAIEKVSTLISRQVSLVDTGICIYSICLSVCMCVAMSVYLFVHICICMYVHTYVCRVAFRGAEGHLPP